MNNTEEQEEPLRFFDVKEFIRTNWGTLFIVFLFSLIAVLCSAVYPYGIKWLTDDVLIQKDIGKLQLILPVMIGSIVLQLLLNYLVSYRMAKIAQSYVLRSKRNMLEGILRNTAIINNNISIHALFTTDYEKVGDLLVEIITTIMSSSLGVIIYLGALVLLNPVLTLITLILIPIVISLNVVMGNHVQKAYFEIQSCLDKIANELSEIEKGMPFIRAFNARKHILSKVVKSNEKLANYNVKYVALMSFLKNSVALVSVVAPFSILLVGSYFVVQNVMSTGSLMAMYTFSSTIFAPITSLLSIIPTTKELVTSNNRINQYFNLQRSIKYDFYDDEKVEFENTSDLQPEIRVNGLSIGYKKTVIQKNIVHCFGPGLTFVCGENAAGKSTFGKTLAGVIPAILGNIKYENVRNIEYVPNDNFLFSTTVYRNLTMGLRDYQIQDLKFLSQLLQLNLPTGMEIKTASSINTGEIQKIKIIRSLLGQSEVVILDEVISNLSQSLQFKLYHYLGSIKDRVIIVIDHNAHMADSFNKVLL